MNLVFDKGIQAIDFLMGVSSYGEALFFENSWRVKADECKLYIHITIKPTNKPSKS